MCRYCSHVQKGGSMADIGPLVKNKRIFQRGGAIIATPRYHFYYSPYTYRGRGIGSVFFKFFKAVSPMLFKGLKSVGKEALSAGTDILANQNGRPIREVFRNRSKQALDNLKRKAQEKIEKVMEGSGKIGIKRQRTRKYNQSLFAIKPVNKRKKTVKRKKTIKRKKSKKITKDIFD